jgi:hypothetical protein
MRDYLADKSGAIFDADGTRLGGVEVDGYEITGVAGTGANAVVFYAWHTLLEREDAIKVYLPRRNKKRDEDDAFEQARQETQKLVGLRHADIATIYHMGQLPWTDWTYVVMEARAGVTLKKAWPKIRNQPGVRREILHRILAALSYAEGRRFSPVLHGDLHGGNVLVLLFRESVLDLGVVDFGTDLFSGREYSEARHAQKLSETAFWLLPELREVCAPTERLGLRTGVAMLPAIVAALNLYNYVNGLTSEAWTPRQIGAYLADAIDYDQDVLWSALRPHLSDADISVVQQAALEFVTHEHDLAKTTLPAELVVTRLTAELQARAIPVPEWARLVATSGA